VGGTNGWAPFPGYIPAAYQTGAFGGTLLNQFPALLPGVQLLNGREGNWNGYYTPTALPVGLGGLTQTTRPNNISGGQLWGAAWGGPIGPIDVQRMMASVTAQQVRQSGVAAMSWAKALAPTYGG
jgi:hypothetical protein